MRLIKITIIGLTLLILLALAGGYFTLWSSLPELDSQLQSEHLSAPGKIQRDALGTAIITASNQSEAAFLLGYAHAQDRLFQMDLLRRSAAGELAELFGEIAIERDKQTRFFQFRQRADMIIETLSIKQKKLLRQYANGVNHFIDENGSPGFEFLLTGSDMAPWTPADSILATFSMYIDLQGGQVERDYENTAIVKEFGPAMLDFMYQVSPYQAAIDLSIVSAPKPEIPVLDEQASAQSTPNTSKLRSKFEDHETQDIGSNNWAVSGHLTDSASAMMSSDMHLGLNVPIIWYRAQLNYQAVTHYGKLPEAIQVTGVSLPGTPLVVAGSNNHIAWGFTNSNVDNVDWVRLKANTPVETVLESIKVKDHEDISLAIGMSEFGPIRILGGEKYALSWVALMPYAVNMDLMDMPLKDNAEEALELAKTIAIPVQNMVVADANGSIAWQLTGAISARDEPSLIAVEESEYDTKWLQQDTSPAFVLNPSNHRVWSANARVISTADLARYGDGGYALGARQRQILDRLLENEQFDEASFNALQFDNRAIFLSPWHNLLLQTLSNSPQKYAADIAALNTWKACACEGSIGYTLVRRYRSALIKRLFSPVDTALEKHELGLRHSTRKIEGAVWQVLQQKPQSWLPNEFDSFDALLLSVYDKTRERLIKDHDANPQNLAGLEWGKVNALKITHPFASSLGPFASLFNMPEVAGFGDSFMPAVQGRSFGASQRLIVRPGNPENAVLTLPGGQSMHPLSKYFRAGFDDYAQGALTPLMPQEIEHEIQFN
ncbi:penicillin acylase family protein [Ningiella sp. W23]|uniref:penicillin acylase family protein n=1 Tax=Ningiella sp. W23 TaxID=3023715 RepID=UPI003757C177